MSRIVFVRHAETHANTERRYLGVTDSPLTQKGIDDTLQLKNMWVSEFQFATIYCSPLGRTQQTAQLLVEELSRVIVPELAEMNFGIWEQKTYDELIRLGYETDLNVWYSSPERVEPPGGEGWVQFTSRIDQFITELKHSPTNQDVLVVTHGGVLQYLLWKYIYKENRHFWEVPKVSHDMWLELTISDLE